MSGKFYVVATPIGNLEDITLRALRILREVDLILCEDKRVTINLLNKYGIKTKLVSFHKFNEHKLLSEVLSILLTGKNIALVSDAGTPLVSDPGSKLLFELNKNNIKIFSIPGPSSLTSVLSIAPFNTDEFLFLGFLPHKKSKRLQLISSLKDRAQKAVIFIGPHDLKKYLIEIFNLYPKADIFYAREMTKMFEEQWCGKIEDLIRKIERDKIRGEIVLILNIENTEISSLFNDKEVVAEMKEYIKSGYSLKEASKLLANKHNLSSKNLYGLYIRRGNS